MASAQGLRAPLSLALPMSPTSPSNGPSSSALSLNLSVNAAGGPRLPSLRVSRMGVADAARVSSVLEDALQKLQLLSMLSTTSSLLGNHGANAANTALDASEDATGSVGGAPIARLLAEQKQAQDRYESLLRARLEAQKLPMEDVKGAGGAGKSKLGSAQRVGFTAEQEVELKTAQSDLKVITKKLCRSLRETPDDADNAKKIARERADIMTVLQACFREIATNLAGALPTPPQNAPGHPQLSIRGGGTTPHSASNHAAGGSSGGFHASASSMSLDATAIAGTPPPASNMSLSLSSPGVSSPGPLSATSHNQGSANAASSQGRQRHSSLLIGGNAGALVTDLPPRDVQFETFAKRVHDAAARHDWALEVVEREKAVQRELKDLRAKMDREASERATNIRDRQTKMENLRRQVAQVMLALRVENEKLSRELDAKHVASARAQALQATEYQQRLERLEIELGMEQRAHATLAEFLDKRNTEARSLLDRWNERYDAETADMERDLEYRNKEREAQVARLQEMETRYAEEVAQEAERQEEARIAAELEAERKRSEQRENAASTIQVAWRGYTSRKKASKKKGKGKGKGKGDDKKKKK
eukprot:ANDGO_03394.mRNA.1 flagellar associated protein